MAEDNKKPENSSDDELLILSDDSSDSNELIFEDTDKNVVETWKASKDSEALISFDEEDNNSLDLSDITKEEKKSDDLVSFDLTDSTEEVKAEAPETDLKIEEDDSSSLFDSVETAEFAETTEAPDMSTILSTTLDKFSERENLIWTDISKRESRIWELKNQLKEEEEKVSKLKSEEQAITRNRKSLEKMRQEFENPKILNTKK